MKHPLAIRWLHWINFPLLLLMVWSGLMIYWANDVYRIGAGEVTLIHFFPQWAYQALGTVHKLSEGMALHFFFMWLFLLNGLLYVTYLAVSGAWREVFPTRDSFKNAIFVTLHDLGLRKDLPPQGTYNGAQKIAYTGVVPMALGSIVTGLAIYKPVQLHWLAALLGGYPAARLEHFWLMMGISGFFVVHVLQVIRAGWNNFRSMVAGFEIVKTPEQL